MTDRLTIALAQLNPTVGDIDGNVALIRDARGRAAGAGADLLVASELVVTGYPPADLVLKPAFQAASAYAIEQLAADTSDVGPALLVGALRRQNGAVYNAAYLLDGGDIAAVRLKHELSNSSVFDESRVFAAGPLPGPMNFHGVRLGAVVCEDMWTADVVECLEESGAEMLVVLNGSPTERNKSHLRLNQAVARITESGLPLIYVNQVGGQDELVFDGGSFVLDADCSLRAQAPVWREHLMVTEWNRTPDGWSCEETERAPPANGREATYQAITLALRDYVRKNGFPGVLVGLSGGIDSAVTATVATDALGAEKVRCVMMPSPYTPRESLEDAAEVARLLEVRLETVSIEPAMAAFGTMLAPTLGQPLPDITARNIQARARGMTLMALSNAGGSMVVATGNKSEYSVGYATLYGDICGGYAPLADIYKTEVFALARWRNQVRPDGALGPAGRLIPERTLTKPPSVELKPGRMDQDSLLPYDQLDQVLAHLIEDDMGIDEIVARGHGRELVRKVWHMLLDAEYRRRQTPPGPQVMRRKFGRDRRYPITDGFKGDV